MKHEFYDGERVVFNANNEHGFPLRDAPGTLVKRASLSECWVVQLDRPPLADELVGLSDYSPRTQCFFAHQKYLSAEANEFTMRIDSIDDLL